MDWFFLIDKPLHLTSFDVIRKLKKLLQIKRIWHTWTLDPLATWLLLIAVWNYTKLIPYFEKDKKSYEFKIMLDWTTETLDIEKEVILCDKNILEQAKNNLTYEKLENILKTSFTWEISQTPPKYSALKIWWQKAYDLARNWVEFEMKKRNITIYDIQIIWFNFPEVHLKATVSAWTYIRTIAWDLWEIIWTWWYISYLRRTHIWNLDLSLAQDLENFDWSKKLCDKILFWENNFIEIDEPYLSKINNWIKIDNFLNLQENKDYFISKNNLITNIVSVIDWQITPVRKI